MKTLHTLVNTYLCVPSIPVTSPERQPLEQSDWAKGSRTNWPGLLLSHRPHCHPTASITAPRAAQWLVATLGTEGTAKPGCARGGNGPSVAQSRALWDTFPWHLPQSPALSGAGGKSLSCVLSKSRALALQRSAAPAAPGLQRGM